MTRAENHLENTRNLFGQTEPSLSFLYRMKDIAIHASLFAMGR